MRFRRLQDWLAWQEGLHGQEIELGLERVGRVLEAMGPAARPAPRVITVGGTNGKGSTVALLEAVLGAAGYRVGSYTSPHLLRYNERVRLDVEPVDDAALCHAFAAVDRARGDTPLTYFEFGTLAALEILAGASVDVAILEVGLGGRLDAVNAVDPDVALVTNVALDHQAWLGEDLASIAAEKAGILRAGRPAVLADPALPRAVFEASGAILRRAGRDYTWRAEDDGWEWRGRGPAHRLPLPALPGAHQLANAAGALAALETLAEDLPVDPAAIGAGLRSVQAPGRFQRVAEAPAVVLDVGHNPHAARGLAKALAAEPVAGRNLAVCATFADKDRRGIVDALAGAFDAWFVAPLEGPRGEGGESLAAIVERQTALPVDSCASPEAALAAALEQAAPGDRVVVFGSFQTAAAAAQMIGQNRRTTDGE